MMASTLVEAIIAKPNIKSFVRALKCLSRIGTELSIEQMPSALIFRTLSQSQSSYSQLTLDEKFFSHFQIKGGGRVRCKVALGNLVNALRSLQSVENGA